jgi:hypothetical protein
LSQKPRASAATEGARKPLRRSETPFDRRRKFAGENPFQLGADVLRLNVDTLVRVYKETIDVAKKMMAGGKANVHLGYFGTLIYTDLLHGGAYACSIDERPYYHGSISGGVFTPGGTPYDPQGLANLPSQGILDWITQLFAGSGPSPAKLFDEVLINANCPHIFPKLLSDEAYGLTKLGLAYAAGTDAFKNAATGIHTLVDAETDFVKGNVEAASEAFGIAERGVALAPKVASLLSLIGAAD